MATTKFSPPSAVVQALNARRRKLLNLLADGRFYSGEDLARQLRVTRSAVWKLIGKLRALGVNIEAVSRRGYRLAHPIELYDVDAIRSHLPPAVAASVHHIEALLKVDSTNRFIADSKAAPLDHTNVCVAEVQSAGRGRRGRTWVAPFASGICLSMDWHFVETPPTLSALGLAVGIAVTRALRRFGAEDVQIKWPNDLIWRQRKLAGVLIEMRGETSGPARVIIGVGLNLRLPPDTRLALAEQQAALVADLHEILQERTPSRNALVAAILDELIAMLRQFAEAGFGAFAMQWRDLDALNNTPVRVLLANETIEGVAQGIASDGALQVLVGNQLRKFMSGDVSVRAAPR